MLFFLFVIPFLYVNGAYNDSFSRYKTWPMASAAYSDAPQLCVKDNFDNSTFIRQIDVPCDILLEICSGFTAISHSDNAIILSFRGASTPHIDVADELWDKMTKFPGGGHVGAYFYNGFMDIWNKGMKDDFLILKNAFPTAELWVTGHSLGAAMASVCAGYISALQYFSPDKIKLVTYGQPRVGDLAYATYIDQTIPYAYRVVHAFDMVPHVPLYGDNIGAIQNYTHHKSEVWYENDMVLGKPYVECDQNEGKNCSDQLEKLGLLDTNVLDHLWYFNVLADYAYFGCKRN